MIRAEACHDDRQAAVDLATDKLMERLRRAHDRRKVHRGRKAPVSVAEATAGLQAPSPCSTGTARPTTGPTSSVRSATAPSRSARRSTSAPR
ncbi:HPF/RaiA family ribosome-associated protein [Janibacter melonis]|uniref:HPF/RaiA family ribosome-associated protein n=1 Tax=Janibacter melonis TaxID=262209 RepID=UPI0027DA28B8|nr:HPF/RaiA family ribosome-associated protein [Janibacter melonis]